MQQPEWVRWNTHHIASQLCSNSCTGSPFPSELKVKVLTRLSKLDFTWPLITSLTCSSLLSAAPTPVVSLLFLNRHQAQSILRSSALFVLSNWNFLPSVANTANSPSFNLYSNLAFWMKLPLTTPLNTTPPASTHTLQHFQSSCCTFSFFHSTYRLLT